MNLFFFFQVSIELSNSFQSQLVHKVNEFRIRNVLLLKSFNSHWIGGRKEGNLLIFRHYIDDFGNYHFEIIWEQFIYFIEDQHFAIFELGNIFRSEIKNSSRSSNDDVNSLVKSVNIFFNRVTTGRNHTLYFFVFSQFLDHKWGLHGKFSSWHENKSLNLIFWSVNSFNERNWIWCSFSSSIFSSCNYILTFQSYWNTFFLNWRWFFITLFVNSELDFFW